VTVKVLPSEERRAKDSLQKLGANFAMEPDSPAGWGGEVNATDRRIGDAELVNLRPFTHLRGLRLGDNVTRAGLANLPSLEQLEELHVTAPGVTDKGLDCLKQLTKLRVLDLKYSSVSDAGLRPLQGMTDLQTLQLFKTKITDRGLAHLRNLKELRFL